MRYLIVFTSLATSGMFLSFYLLVFRPDAFRSILRTLWALSYGIEDGIASFRGHRSDRLGKTGKAVVAVKPAAVILRPVLQDVKDGLMGQGMSEAWTNKAVAYADAKLPGSNDFTLLFKAAVEKRAA